ncbi:hypothetical protein OSH05_23620 [Kaistia algarum]|nr:hypothetical protein [Kaistia algarum]
MDLKVEQDLIGLWQIVDRVRETSPELAGERLVSESLNLVRDMLVVGFKAGSSPYAPNGFKLWPNKDTDAIVEKIGQDWALLGRDPDLADIVWFLPPALNN